MSTCCPARKPSQPGTSSISVVAVSVSAVNSYYFTVLGSVERAGYYTSRGYVTAVEDAIVAGRFQLRWIRNAEQRARVIDCTRRWYLPDVEDAAIRRLAAADDVSDTHELTQEVVGDDEDEVYEEEGSET